MCDLGGLHNKIRLIVYYVLLNSQTAQPPEGADGKAHFANWSDRLFHGFKQFVWIDLLTKYYVYALKEHIRQKIS